VSHAVKALFPTQPSVAPDPEGAVAVSVIVPVTERPEELAQLYQEYSEPLRLSGRTFEFLFVVEPWFEDRTEALSDLVAAGAPIRILQPGQAVGETALLRSAVAKARAPIVVTLPAYRRVMAPAIPALVERIEKGADVAVARRWPRHDSWVNRIQTKAFHYLLGRVSGGRLHDVACGVRAMRRDVLEKLPLYGDFARFMPVLALREGYDVDELAWPQHRRDAVSRVYGPGVYLRRVIDLFGLFFLLRFTEKPLRFFGLLGASFAMAGAGVLILLLLQRLAGQGIGDRPLLLLGVLLFVLGVQAIALGLVGEIIVHLHSSGRRSYRLARDQRSNS
jgi:hypothetical protein